MTISKWPDQERPRERLIQLGAERLTNAELLAILLSNGTRGKNAVEVARELLVEFQGLRGLFSADLHSLSLYKGLGMAKYCLLQAALELGRRHLQEAVMRQSVIKHSLDAHNFLRASLRSFEHEVFACLFLDNHHRVIRFEQLFHGTVNRATVHSREVVKRGLYHNATAVIAAHNHPSGIADPSEADCRLTQELKLALQLVDIQLLDHIIIGDTQTISLAEQGLI